MSDPGRKDFSTSLYPPSRFASRPVAEFCAGAREEITPDDTKSTQQKAKEAATDATDRIARGTQSDNSKSTGQSVHDKTQRESDRENHGGALHSVGDKVKSALGMNK